MGQRLRDGIRPRDTRSRPRHAEVANVYAIILPENVRSIRVTERLGMKPLGLTMHYYDKQALHFAWESSNKGGRQEGKPIQEKPGIGS
jgi:hypothetical protein